MHDFRTSDVIEVNNMRFKCIIGARESERRSPREIIVSLRIASDMREAGDSDSLSDCYDYRQALETIGPDIESSRYTTLEALATMIARTFIVDFDAPEIAVRVLKDHFPTERTDSAGVNIFRNKSDFVESEPTSS